MRTKLLLQNCLFNLTTVSKRTISHHHVKLNYVSYPPDLRPLQNKPPLVIVHGLFGHASNWNSVAKALQVKLNKNVIVAELRNHGDSAHMASMSFEEMASDLEHMIPEWAPEINKCVLLGHSLGGKVVSYLALDKPHLIDKLILEDIVPKSYPMSRYVDMAHFVKSMRNSTWKNETTLSDVRKEVDKQLVPVIQDLPTRQFILTNLVERNGKVVWKLNLDVIEKFIPVMFGFPENVLTKQYKGPTFVVWGDRTIHFNPAEDEAYLQKLFPSLKIQMIPDCGHWIHAQKPKEFMEAVVNFLS